MKRTVLINR